jgi:hypothetical protein
MRIETATHEIVWDGRCVWVNDDTGCCIGRFTRMGVDVHKTGPDQLETGQQCLDCFHDADPRKSWNRFVVSMRAHHAIDIPADAKPDFCRAEVPTSMKQ